jgi:transcriptional regulator with XRE-family HTH domain
MDEVSNPFKKIREDKGLSQQFIAARANVGTYLVLRTEQATFPSPPPSVLRVFTRILHQDEDELVEGYLAYQRWVRRTNGRRVLGEVPTLKDLPPNVHPFVFWKERQNLNTTGISKAFCVAQPVLSHFENKPRLQQTVPKQFLDALRDAGYTSHELETFEALYDRHRAYLRISALTAPVGTPSDREPAA